MINSNIIKHLYDNESEFIYNNRVKYSQTGDRHYIRDIVDKTVRSHSEWTSFCQFLKEKSSCGDMVIFGAGIWGYILYSETADLINWKCAVDSNPERKIKGMTCIGFDEFIENYRGEIVAISSYKNYYEMLQQLQKCGVTEENIINAGKVIYKLTEYAIYFDLPAMALQRPKEVFVDAGAFDGLTTRRFFEWCSNKACAYCFEPDPQNIERINKNLSGRTDYRVIHKVLWSKSCTVPMEFRGSFATSVSLGGASNKDTQMIEATSLDAFLMEESERDVTFIKMDIEGAEKEALLGAKDTITRLHPRLAVSIYHRLEDIYELPELILSFYSDYKLYLRHYSFSDYDTVLYAISQGDRLN